MKKCISSVPYVGQYKLADCLCELHTYNVCSETYCEDEEVPKIKFHRFFPQNIEHLARRQPNIEGNQ